jgi:hypothetical protein
MSRTGMATLIRRVRGMAQVGTADYSIVIGTGATVVWWSDDHVQEVLDLFRMDFQGVPIAAGPEFINGTSVFKNYYAPGQNWEEATSGSVYWLVTNSAGSDPGTANYTVDYLAGLVRFNSDQGGTSFFLTGRTYNLNAAAADIWRQKGANAGKYVDFQSDDQAFKKSQFFDHCLKMASYWDSQSGIRTVRKIRKDLLPPGLQPNWSDLRMPQSWGGTVW